MRKVEYEWERDDQTVTIEIGYSYSRPVPATYLDPPEGGVEVDTIAATKIQFFDEDGEPLDRTATIEELTEAEQAFPSARAYWIAMKDHDEMEDEARERAAEMKGEY